MKEFMKEGEETICNITNYINKNKYDCRLVVKTSNGSHIKKKKNKRSLWSDKRVLKLTDRLTGQRNK